MGENIIWESEVGDLTAVVFSPYRFPIVKYLGVQMMRIVLVSPMVKWETNSQLLLSTWMNLIIGDKRNICPAKRPHPVKRL